MNKFGDFSFRAKATNDVSNDDTLAPQYTGLEITMYKDTKDLEREEGPQDPNDPYTHTVE